MIAEDENARPSAVILDISIANDSRGLTELEAAIRRLTERRGGDVDVYASVNPFAGAHQTAADVWNEHAQDLYRDVLTGYGHTALRLFMGVLSYVPELELSADGGTELLTALPAAVAAVWGSVTSQRTARSSSPSSRKLHSTVTPSRSRIPSAVHPAAGSSPHEPTARRPWPPAWTRRSS